MIYKTHSGTYIDLSKVTHICENGRAFSVYFQFEKEPLSFAKDYLLDDSVPNQFECVMKEWRKSKTLWYKLKALLTK